MEPDPSSALFGKFVDGQVLPMDEHDWARLFLDHTLSASVPKSVAGLFEVARGTVLYGFYFYPLYTLGLEQLFRVTEAALTAKCQDLGAPAGVASFQRRIGWLVSRQAIRGSDRVRWDAIRMLRNSASHPSAPSILPPAEVVHVFRSLVGLVNACSMLELVSDRLFSPRYSSMI